MSVSTMANHSSGSQNEQRHGEGRPATASHPALEAHDLYRFRQTLDGVETLLRGVSLKIEAGSLVAIVGLTSNANDALMRCLAGLDEPDSGWIAIAGAQLTHRPEPDRTWLITRKIGHARPETLLSPDHSIYHQLLVTMGVRGMLMRRQARLALYVAKMSERMDAKPAELTPGERVRAALAIAIVNDPLVLLVDELDESLGDEEERLVLTILQERARSGIAVIVVTNNIQITSAADRVLVLSGGSIHELRA